MKPILIAAAAAFALVGSASAATMVTTTGTPLTYMIHNPGGEPDGNQQTLVTMPGGYLVDYTSSDTLHDNGNSGGFAKISGVGGLGGAGFGDLTIDPENPIAGFSAIKFNIIIPTHSSAQDVPTHTDFTFDTRVYFQGGGFQDFLDTAAAPPQRYLVSDPTKTISSIVFSDLEGTVNVGTHSNPIYQTTQYKFDGIEQVSFDAVFAAVPEPATWAIMIVGFFGLGAQLRRRKAALA